MNKILGVDLKAQLKEFANELTEELEATPMPPPTERIAAALKKLETRPMAITSVFDFIRSTFRWPA